MRELDNEAAATRDCSRCGGRAFYWRSAIVVGDPQGHTGPGLRHQPAWTCMYCGYIEPHERRQQAIRTSTERRHL
jgi:hypothetical protein